MKAAPLAILLAAWVSVAMGQDVRDDLPSAPQGKTWKMVWHDEFDGTKLDTTKWDIPEYQRQGGYWSRKAISLDGKGHLVMSVLKGDGKFLDGCVRTKGKFEHAFGYYVARIQLQKQQGHWTAFWLFNTSVKPGNDGRKGTEIDIYEKPWLDDRVQHTLHWGGYGKGHKSEGKVVKVPAVMEGWHTFSLLWLPDEYVFLRGRQRDLAHQGGRGLPSSTLHQAK